ncbi:hypothetical protein, partial [Pseudomonas viridiflava]|uniref:hypothetical protein n=1 Tax=Pseudomonas viridiflava TaxID=33069 RepID=UPI001981830F
MADGELQQRLEVELFRRGGVTEHLRCLCKKIGMDAGQVGSDLGEQKAYVLRTLGDINLLRTAGSDKAGFCPEP